MRTLRVLALVVVVALVVVPSIVVAVTSSASETAALKTAPAKVCHPKSPVPCKSTEIVAPQQAMLCIPRVACRNEGFESAPKVESQQAMLCIPRVACNQNTLA